VPISSPFNFRGVKIFALHDDSSLLDDLIYVSTSAPPRFLLSESRIAMK